MQNLARTHPKWVYIVAVVIGIAGVTFGVHWGMTHAGEPEIFSPALLGYVGAALTLYSGWRLVTNQRQSHH